MSMSGFLRRATAVTATALLLSSCGSSDQGGQGDAVSFQMHWAWSPSTAGFAVAQDQDLYQQAGVDATLTEGKGSGNAVQLVAAGRADMGIADAVAIAQQVEQGAPLLVVATINQTTNVAMQALDSSGIESVEDLEGKTVAVPPGGAFSFLFPLFLELNGLNEDDVQVANMPFESMVPSLIAGEVDAIVGGQDSYVALASQGEEFTDFPFGDYGVDAVAHSIFTTQDFAEENPEAVREVVAASLQGWSYARDNSDEALADIEELQPDTVPENARTEWEVLSPLLCSGGAESIGLAGPDRWQSSMEMLEQADLLTDAPDVDSFVSYDFLPDDADLTSCA